MKNIKNKIFALLVVCLAFPYPGSSLDSLTFELRYEVHKIYPPISITSEKLSEAHTLIDLNKNYQSSWVREYISVGITTCNNGKLQYQPIQYPSRLSNCLNLCFRRRLGFDFRASGDYVF